MSTTSELLRLTSLPQKLVLGVLAAALIAAVGFNFVQMTETRHLTKANQALTQRIDDPTTGYVVKLSQARTNTATCTTAIARQNELLREQSAQGQATVAAVQRRYDAEHDARLRSERDTAAFLAREPQGNSLAERIADIDAQILGDLQ